MPIIKLSVRLSVPHANLDQKDADHHGRQEQGMADSRARDPGRGGSAGEYA